MEADNEQNATEKNEKIKTQGFAKALPVILRQIIIPKSQYLTDHILISKLSILSL